MSYDYQNQQNYQTYANAGGTAYPYLAPPKKHRGLAVAALVLGIVGCVFGLIPLTFEIALAAGILALIFGFIGHKHGLGKAGIVLSVIAIALGIWGAVIVNQVSNDLDDYSNCIDHSQTLEQMNKC